MKISMLKQGQKFLYGGIKWIKLDSDKKGALAIAADSIFSRKFDKDEWNYWTASLLRMELNREFIVVLFVHGGQWKHLVPINTDLTAKDGMKDYGDTEDCISLLTTKLFMQYKEFIPNINASWWTATPWSCKEDYLNRVCVIDSQGKLVQESANESELGVRPLCKLKNTIHIELV